MESASSARPARLAGALAVLLAALVYWPVLRNGFVNWDDGRVLFGEPHLRSLSWENVRWIFTHLHGDSYHPLCLLLFSGLHHFWGLDPLPYHAASLLIHLAMTAGVFAVSWRLLKTALPPSPDEENRLILAASFAALLFSLHPLQAEPVASVSYLTDIPACLFALYAILAYLHGRLGLSLALYLASGLSRWQGVSLPVILLVLNIYPLKRLKGEPKDWLSPEARKVWRELAPYALIAAAILLVHAWAKAGEGYHAVGARPLAAASGLVFYPWKWLLPRGLLPVYVLEASRGYLGLAGAATILLYLARRRWPAGLAVWACYAAAIAPTLGFSADGPMFAHDRYAYFSCLGFPVLAAAGLFLLGGKRPRLALIASVFFLANLGRMTFAQVQVWHDPESLWRNALAIDPSSTFANFRMGSYLLWEKRDYAGAIQCFERQRRVDPQKADINLGFAYNALGASLYEQGKFEEAAENFKQALRHDPGRLELQNNLRAALSKKVGRKIP